MIKLKKIIEQEYIHTCGYLSDKKSKLYSEGKFRDWGINPEKYCIDKKTLKNNKIIACHLMLPN